jgi:D-alanyl-lipoteichoic acid acyltransferase DltB (MBOAT superfamily)
LLFTTLTFLVFLPIVLAAYWLCAGQRARNAVLVAASYFFYGWWDYRYAVLMAGASLVDFAAALLLERTASLARRRLILAASCAFSLGLLGYFKYAGFFVENAAALAGALGLHLSTVDRQIVLPVGISFYTFQTLSYVIDVYRHRMRATHDLLEYMAYVSFFPQLVAGPIERAGHLLPQFHSLRIFDAEAARDGLRFMAWGFFKKLAIADNLGLTVDHFYRSVASWDGPTLALATVCFAFQIYCDFSAYSDIATGCARLFGVDLMRNFAYPYFSRSVAEFWRRWHISLSTWFADYVYVPLGGSRCGRWRRALNVMVTFVLSGLWHGASWNFVIWGALNGLAVLPSVVRGTGPRLGPQDVPGGESDRPSLRTLLAMAATFTFVCFAWIFFRAATPTDATFILVRLLSGPWSVESVTEAVGRVQQGLGMIGAFTIVEWLARRGRHPLAWPRLIRPLRWAGYTAVLWLTLWFAREQAGAFIYFQF